MANKKQVVWSRQYNAKAYDDIKIRVPKGMRDTYKAMAKEMGTSLNKLVVDFLDAEHKKSHEQ